MSRHSSNIAPVVSCTYTPTGLTVAADASASYDPDGSIVRYLWNWGDGHTHYQETPTTTHTYAVPGTYRVGLTVTDNKGTSRKLSVSVSVSGTNPVPLPAPTVTSVTIAGPTSVTAGQSVTYGASAHYSDGTVVAVTPTWSSSNAAVASISAAGVCSAVAAGTASIQASYSGVTATPVTVTVAAVVVVLPSAPTTLAPLNGASGVALAPSLLWSAANATTYTVKFGTSPTPSAVSTGQASAGYTPGTLAYSTTYYWQILAINGSGTTTGAIWSFTTLAAPPAPIPDPLVLTAPTMTPIPSLGGVPVSVSYACTVTGGTSPVVSYNPASGSLFPVGTTSVTATATDLKAAPVSVTFSVVVYATTAPPPTSGLITAYNIAYVGSFAPPGVGITPDPGGSTFEFAGAYPGGFTYDPVNDSVLLTGGIPISGQRKYVGEFTRVAPIVSTHFASLNQGVAVQGMTDVTGGLMDGSITNTVTGLYVSGGVLYVETVKYYDALGAETRGSYRASSRTLAGASFSGPYQLAASPDAQGHPITNSYTGGPMCAIPAAYQAALGGTALVMGEGATISISSRLSFGPCCFALNPANINLASLGGVVPSHPLVYYPPGAPVHTLPMAMGVTDHLYSNQDEGTVWTGWDDTTGPVGIVWPTNSKSILFIGQRGAGVRAYGMGVASLTDPPLDTTLPGHSTGAGASTSSDGRTVTVPNHVWAGENWIRLSARSTPVFSDGTHAGCTRIVSGSWANSGTPSASCQVYHAFTPNLTAQAWELSAEVNIYDPVGVGGPGPHAYPYENVIWAYSVDDFLAVRAGTKQPWEILPYATWTFALPWTFNEALGVPIAAPQAMIGATYDPTRNQILIGQYRAYGDFPVIHVYQLS